MHLGFKQVILLSSWWLQMFIYASHFCAGIYPIGNIIIMWCNHVKFENIAVSLPLHATYSVQRLSFAVDRSSVCNLDMCSVCITHNTHWGFILYLLQTCQQFPLESCELTNIIHAYVCINVYSVPVWLCVRTEELQELWFCPDVTVCLWLRFSLRMAWTEGGKMAGVDLYWME